MLVVNLKEQFVTGDQFRMEGWKDGGREGEMRLIVNSGNDPPHGEVGCHIRVMLILFRSRGERGLVGTRYSLSCTLRMGVFGEARSRSVGAVSRARV